MDKLSRTDRFLSIGRCKISRLLFANNLVLLALSESGLQHVVNGFAAAFDIAGISITEVLHLLRNTQLKNHQNKMKSSQMLFI